MCHGVQREVYEGLNAQAQHLLRQQNFMTIIMQHDPQNMHPTVHRRLQLFVRNRGATFRPEAIVMQARKEGVASPQHLHGAAALCSWVLAVVRYGDLQREKIEQQKAEKAAIKQAARQGRRGR